MGVADIVVLALIVYGVYRGASWGVWYQLSDLVLLIATILVTTFAAGPMAHAVVKRVSGSYNLTYFLCAVVVVLVVQIAGWFVLQAIRKAWLKSRGEKLQAAPKKLRARPDDPLKLLDKIGGGIVGAVTTSLLLWFVLSLVVVVREDLSRHVYGLRDAQSTVMKVAIEHNAVMLFLAPQVSRLDASLQRAATKAQAAGKHVASARVFSDPRLKALAADKELQKELASGNAAHLLRSPHALSVLTDPDAMNEVGKDSE
jgi:uncharacterized membrane protein required for colicin V production